MKKRNWSFFCALVGLALLLTACAAPVQGEGRLLEFPKTSWEMTPEEVMAAYGVSQDAVTTSDSGEQPAFAIEQLECFGETTSHAVFSFQEDDAGVLRLVNVLLVYPDEADMAQVKALHTNGHRRAPGCSGTVGRRTDGHFRHRQWKALSPGDAGHGHRRGRAHPSELAG